MDLALDGEFCKTLVEFFRNLFFNPSEFRKKSNQNLLEVEYIHALG